VFRHRLVGERDETRGRRQDHEKPRAREADDRTADKRIDGKSQQGGKYGGLGHHVPQFDRDKATVVEHKRVGPD